MPPMRSWGKEGACDLTPPASSRAGLRPVEFHDLFPNSIAYTRMLSNVRWGSSLVVPHPSSKNIDANRTHALRPLVAVHAFVRTRSQLFTTGIVAYNFPRPRLRNHHMRLVFRSCPRMRLEVMLIETQLLMPLVLVTTLHSILSYCSKFRHNGLRSSLPAVQQCMVVSSVMILIHFNLKPAS